MHDHDYPSSVVEVLDDGAQFNQQALRAVKGFAADGPWTGSQNSRKEKFIRLNRELAAAYDIEAPNLTFGLINRTCSGASHYIPSRHKIVITGRLSVVTYLHEFAHARGLGERASCRWSINLFRRCFPEQFARLVARGHMLISPASLERRTGTGTR